MKLLSNKLNSRSQLIINHPSLKTPLSRPFSLSLSLCLSPAGHSPVTAISYHHVLSHHLPPNERRNQTTTTAISSHEQTLISLLSQLALSFDGAVLGVALAYAPVRTVLKLNSVSSALRKLHKAPSVKVSHLRSILTLDHSDEAQPSDTKIVVVRGPVEAKSAVDDNWNILNSVVLVSQGTKDRAVVLQRTQTVSSIELMEGDTIVTGGDELFDNVFDHEIVSTLAGYRDVAQAAKELANLASNHSLDSNFDSPYSMEARSRGFEAPLWKKILGMKPTGGWPDHITVIVGQVVSL